MLSVLQYHEISESIVFNPNICPKKLFEKHLKLLNETGICDASPKLKENKIQFHFSNSCEVLITFDDGYKGVFRNAFPLMEKYGYKGLVFVVSGYLNSTSKWDVPLLTPLPHLSKQEVKTLYKNGWLIGSHSHTHPDLTRLSPKQIKEEIVISKKIIEDLIGDSVMFFSFPFGKFDQRVKEILIESGFKLAFKSSSLVRKLKDNMEIPRRSVYIFDFWIKLKLDPFYYYIECTKEVIANNFAYLTPLFKNIFKLHQI